MTATLEPEAPAPFLDFVTIDRFRDGRPVKEELLIRYAPPFGPLPATLAIGSDWSAKAGTYRKYATYGLTEEPSPLGRAFRLERAADAVAKDPDHETHYGVLVGAGGKCVCECKGGQATEARGRLCKHQKAILFLLSEKQL